MTRQMLRFKVKTTPNKTTVRKMLQALFLQHFNGFTLHGTFVVCQEIYIIFSKIKFFPLEYCYCFVVIQQVHCQKPPVYTAESCSNENGFLFFSTKSEQTAIQRQSHIINPLLTECEVCTGKYCLRFLSHRPRSFVARSVRKPQAILSRTDLVVIRFVYFAHCSCLSTLLDWVESLY